MANKEYCYTITASMCGLQSGNSTFERLKETSNLVIAIFWFIVFIFEYPMVNIIYCKNIPKCKKCKSNQECQYKVDGI